MLLTQAEEERLTELLRDIDEEEENSARGTDNEVSCHGRAEQAPSDFCKFLNTSSSCLRSFGVAS